MKEVPTLWLDTLLDFYPVNEALARHGIQLKLIHAEGGDWRGDAYRVSRETVLVTTVMTETGGVELIIIGNNNGVGVEKASYVADKMKYRTLIVWNSYSPGCDEGPYSSMGFKHFGSRRDLPELVCNMLLRDA